MNLETNKITTTIKSRIKNIFLIISNSNTKQTSYEFYCLILVKQ
jgi:hypothetical protein